MTTYGWPSTRRMTPFFRLGGMAMAAILRQQRPPATLHRRPAPAYNGGLHRQAPPEPIMISKVERFWITFILRFAFGFLFLLAAINQFRLGPEAFSTQLSTPFQTTWLGDIDIAGHTGMEFVKGFLYAVPFILAGLSVPILTGIWLRPALRL